MWFRLHLSIALLLCTAYCAAQISPTELVHPLIGTAAEGQTFPATGVPFAMTDWTPQTRDGEVKCVAPYYFPDTAIQGFRGSHFLSGSCTQEYGSFTVMPGSGPLKLGAKERASSFVHAEEQTLPYRYSVNLRDYGIRVEMTGTARSGFMRFRYDRPGPTWLVIQTNGKPNAAEGSVHIDRVNHEISGRNAVTRLYAGAGKPTGFSGYFIIQFDHPFRSGAAWEPCTGAPSAAIADLAGASLVFDLRPGETLQLRVGTSFTSVEEARRNLQSEIPAWDFNRTAAAAKAAWNESLGKVMVVGQAPQKAVFYTALYHSMLLPRIFSDADGSYPSFGGGQHTETARGFTYYDDFSIWDTFRALHPLMTILDPSREGEMVASLVAKGQQGGFLPIFPAWNSYTSEMVGDHAGAVIVDAYVKGIRGFDPEEAYRLMRHNAIDSPSTSEYQDGKGRRALVSYLRYGYIPLEDRVPFSFHQDEQVSRTLEYAYDDFLVGRLADALGKQEDAALFAARARNWRNVIDPETGFARGRHQDGTWITPFDPGKPASFITEGLPFQYTFFVPQDIPGLIDLLHGNMAFDAKLDVLFASGFYDQGNEPSHHIAFLYNAAGIAWKTQQHVRDILDRQYTDRIDGLCGNDDAGQMSAWYVMAALGLYQVTPGVPTYELSTPRFDDTTINLPGDHKLHILAHGSEAGDLYIRSVSLNGKPLAGHTITHSQIISGGELIFTLSKTPVPKWPTVTK